MDYSRNDRLVYFADAPSFHFVQQARLDILSNQKLCFISILQSNILDAHDHLFNK
jgi:hypothetical protein